MTQGSTLIAGRPFDEATVLLDEATVLRVAHAFQQAIDWRYLWTHKTQNRPWLLDEELLIDRAEGVWVWTQTGKKLLDGFAGLAVVNVGQPR